QPGAFIGREARTVPGVSLRLAYPSAQALGGTSELLGHRPDRRPLRGVLIGVLKNHPDGALTQFRGIFAGSCHWVHPLSELTLRQTRAASKRGEGHVRDCECSAPRDALLRRDAESADTLSGVRRHLAREEDPLVGGTCTCPS